MVGKIASYLNNYRKTECPSIDSEGMLFSRFGIDMVLFDKILSKNAARVSQVWTDSPGDLQIDGLCILIDDEIVTDVDDAKSLIMMRGGMEQVQKIDLYFIQSKCKKSFSLNEFNHFKGGVENFITNKKVPAKVTPKIENWFRVWKVIDDEIRKVSSKPDVIVNMLIVFNGNSIENELLVDQMRNFQQNLPSCSSATWVKYKVFGTSELIEIYKRRIAASQRQRVHISRPVNSFIEHRTREVQSEPRRQFTNYQQNSALVSISEVKNAIRQCIQDPNGYVFLADLGAKISVNGTLKSYLAKYPQHFQFDNIHLPLKVKIAGEGYHASSSVRGSSLTASSVEKRNELRKIISGRVTAVDTVDWSGTIDASGYGNIPFYFSDLVYPEQENELSIGALVRFEVTTWCDMTKVKSNTLQVI